MTFFSQNLLNTNSYWL